MQSFKDLTIACAGSAFLLASLHAHAVQMDGGSIGEVLIVPYFGTLNGNATLVTIQDTFGKGKAVKLNFKNRMGETVTSLNAYLGVQDSWGFSVEQQGGQTVLTTNDASCVFDEVGPVGPSKNLSEDSGYIEIIEMGSVTRNIVDVGNCEELADNWSENGQWSSDPEFGLKAPIGGLKASVTLVNVAQGALYKYQAVALQDFSTIIQHTRPGLTIPDLSSAHDSGTDSNATRSAYCIQGGCYEDTWDEPGKAVQAVLMSSNMIGEFNIEPGIDGATEVILLLPFGYESLPVPVEEGFGFFINVIDREGNAIRSGESECNFVGDLFVRCNGGFWFLTRERLSFLSFNQELGDEPYSVETPITGELSATQMPSEVNPVLPTSGAFDIGPYVHIGTLVSNEGTHFSGYPTIGVVLQKYNNGYLTDIEGNNVKATYGGAVSVGYKKISSH